MNESDPEQDLGRGAAELLRTILNGTASETGEPFFRALVENLCRALGTQGAWVTEYLPERRLLRALAFRTLVVAQNRARGENLTSIPATYLRVTVSP